MPRILAIDDEHKILDILTFYLKEAGFEVEAFNNLEDGIQSAGQNEFDLVILDIVLESDQDGYGVARSLKKVHGSRDVPILFASAKLEMPDLFLKNFDGRADFIQKPFKKEDLLKKVRCLLGSGAEA